MINFNELMLRLTKKSIRLLVQNAKLHREKELKKAEDQMNKAKQRAENSTKEFKEKEQVRFFN